MTIIYKQTPLIKITINHINDCISNKDSFTLTKDLFNNVSSKKRELLLEMINNSEDFIIMNDFGMCRYCSIDYYKMDDESVSVYFRQYSNLSNVKIKGVK